MTGDLPSGLYWVRFFPDDTEWQPAHHDAGEWWLIGVADPQPRVAEVGPPVVGPDAEA